MIKPYFKNYPEISEKQIEEMEKYDPLEYLITKAKKTQIDQVYLELKPFINKANPFIFLITGPSGAGKDSSVQPLITEGKLTLITSATNRDRRPGEDKDSYIWMRKQREGEDLYKYYESLVSEYNLIEHNLHHRNMYGLPATSLKKAVIGKPGLIHTENNGAKTLKERLGSQFNIITVFIVPESYINLWERMENRDNKLIRFQKSIEEIKDARQIANYYILNNRTLENLQEAFRNLFMAIVDTSDQSLKI